MAKNNITLLVLILTLADSMLSDWQCQSGFR